MKGARKLAALIRKGHTMIGEDWRWLVGKHYANQYGISGPCGCAIGAAAAVGAGYKVTLSTMECFPEPLYEFLWTIVPEASVELFRKISSLHFGDKMPRLKIADWLEAEADRRGEPKQDHTEVK